MKKEVKEWLKKNEEIKKGSMDLSRDEDLSIAIMNLVSLEEHFYFSAMKSNDGKYLEMLNSVRKIRGEMLKEIVTEPEAEEWCISKHLLGASMRLMEVGTKELGRGQKKKAEHFFNRAFDVYSMFFAINLKLVKSQKLTEEKDEGMMKKFSNKIKELIDCCKEW